MWGQVLRIDIYCLSGVRTVAVAENTKLQNFDITLTLVIPIRMLGRIEETRH
jgi:hypothetical protein